LVAVAVGAACRADAPFAYRAGPALRAGRLADAARAFDWSEWTVQLAAVAFVAGLAWPVVARLWRGHGAALWSWCTTPQWRVAPGR
jgi:hypothetical protein